MNMNPTPKLLYDGSRPIPFSIILDTVLRERRVSFQSIAEKGRHPDVVLARSMLVWLAREATFMSYPEIGRAMGQRNHSTAVTAHHRIIERIERCEWTEHGGQKARLTDVLDLLLLLCKGEDDRQRREVEKAKLSRRTA